MTGRLSTFLEWLSPGRVRRASIPPLEAGLRPNSRLDEARVLGTFEGDVVDDVALVDGAVVVGAGTRLLRLGQGGSFEPVAELDGRVGSLSSLDRSAVAAVAGEGIVRVDPDGAITTICDDARVRDGVTAITTMPDRSLLVCIGASTGDWTHNLVGKGSTGSLLRVDDGGVAILAEDLPYPSGVALDGDGHFLLSLSLGMAVERRELARPDRAEPILRNLPGYPGRIAACGASGWWVAVPYMRNRASELLLQEKDLADEMVRTIEPEAWLVPTLGPTNIYRAPLQVGQIRVLGEVKPWAPPRSYGLAFRLDRDGHVAESVHSRADGDRHGVTGVAIDADGRVVLVCAGAGVVVRLEESR